MSGPMGTSRDRQTQADRDQRQEERLRELEKQVADLLLRVALLETAREETLPRQ